MENLIIILGLIAILLGIASWMGWYPTVRRTGLFGGGTHADLIIMGAGMVIIGVSGSRRVLAAGLIGLICLVLVVVGFVLGLISPSWLVPRWYEERYPDPTPPT